MKVWEEYPGEDLRGFFHEKLFICSFSMYLLISISICSTQTHTQKNCVNPTCKSGCLYYGKYKDKYDAHWSPKAQSPIRGKKDRN